MCLADPIMEEMCIPLTNLLIQLNRMEHPLTEQKYSGRYEQTQNENATTITTDIQTNGDPCWSYGEHGHYQNKLMPNAGHQ